MAHGRWNRMDGKLVGATVCIAPWVETIYTIYNLSEQFMSADLLIYTMYHERNQGLELSLHSYMS